MRGFAAAPNVQERCAPVAHPDDSLMLALHRLRLIATHLPRGISGAAYHRWGLEAMHRRRFEDADRLFERGARAYREALEVEPLARLRVHQLMGRLLAGREGEGESCLQVERMLSNLDRIESPEPDFELMDAKGLLGSWLSRTAPKEASTREWRAAAA